MSLLKEFWKDENGASGLEYAMIGAFMSIMVIAGATSIGTKMNSNFSSVSSGLG